MSWSHQRSPRGGHSLLGIQVLHAPLHPEVLGVTTELLALPGGEDHPCLGTDAPVGDLVAYYSVLRNFLGNEGNAASRKGDDHGACRDDAVGTQGQEQEDGDKGCGGCHVLAKGQRRQFKGQNQGAGEERLRTEDPVPMECPELSPPFIGAARRKLD